MKFLLIFFAGFILLMCNVVIKAQDSLNTNQMVSTLTEIQHSASANRSVLVKLNHENLKINVDRLTFDIENDTNGYLTIISLGSDGKSIDILYPNPIDGFNQLNFINSGKHHFPSDQSQWSIQPNGPIGDGYVLVIVSDKWIDFTNKFNISTLSSSGVDLLKKISDIVQRNGRYGAALVKYTELE